MAAKKGETKEITKKAETAEDKEFKGSGVEGTKDAEEVEEKPYVTGEDVIKKLRKKGHKI